MKFTLSWLRELVDVTLSAEALADKLTMLGLEVDAVVDLHHDLDNVLVGRIHTVTPHPGADRLTVCEVGLGAETRVVVCGAANVRPGLVTAIAVPGCKLPSGIEVREATIRGVRSAGMLCSEKELAISQDHAGIIELPTELEEGVPLADSLALRDTVIEVDLTPNRPDCASVLGIAREVAGFTGSRLRLPVKGVSADQAEPPNGFTVTVESSGDCPRYAARRLSNVNIAPSPWWLKKRLLAIGQRPINNVVDITNLVMMEMGQPLHAFDFDKLAGSAIIVRRARQGETIETLDNVERRLDQEMLLICDSDKPVAVAGVMGGANSEVGNTTTEILLESACFDPVCIRRTARRLNLSSEASYRFERGIDPDGCIRAMQRAVELLVEISGATVVQGGADEYGGQKELPCIPLRVGRTRELLGMDLSGDAIASCLEAIDLSVERQGDDLLQVRPPSFRVDLEREIDLVEEVARLQGYNEIPTRLPCVPLNFPEQDVVRILKKKAAGIMVSMGFSEAINYSFGNAAHFDQLQLEAEDPLRRTVRLLNPLSEEQAVMRTMLLPGLLDTVRGNVNRLNNDIRLFELGKVFLSAAGTAANQQPLEQHRLTAVLSGRRNPFAPELYYGDPAVDVYDAKGTLEQLIDVLRLQPVRWLTGPDVAPYTPTFVEHGVFAMLQAASTSEESVAPPLGLLGQVKGKVLRSFGIKQDVYFLDLDFDALTRHTALPTKFSSLPKFPAVNRDIAMVVPEPVEAGHLVEALRNSNEPLVEHVELFDVYRGKPIEPGYKSVAIAVTYRAAEQTLDDRTVDQVHQRLVDMVLSRFEGRMREAGGE